MPLLLPLPQVHRAASSALQWAWGRCRLRHAGRQPACLRYFLGLVACAFAPGLCCRRGNPCNRPCMQRQPVTVIRWRLGTRAASSCALCGVIP